MNSSRRSLLKSGLGLGAALALTPVSTARAVSSPRPARSLFEISLAQWSLHRSFFGGQLEVLDFAQIARGFGLEAIEYVNQFFKDKAADFDYLRELKTRAEDEGVESLLIMIDGEGWLAHAFENERNKAIENHFKWIAAARFLGCHSIRVNAAGRGEPEELMKRAADSLRRLAVLGDDYGIDVIVENHGGHSSNGQWLAGVMKMADHPRVGTLPDFGNFKTNDGEYDRYKGVTELMPFAKAVSAKSHDFDEQGNETHTDYRRMMKIVLDAGYRGFVGVEYEGTALSEDAGIRRTVALLETVRRELLPEYEEKR